MSERIVAVGLLTSRDLEVLGPTFDRIWPVEDAPRSVTVLAGSCVEAGTLSTLAYLCGPGAAEFLQDQGVLHWVM